MQLYDSFTDFMFTFFLSYNGKYGVYIRSRKIEKAMSRQSPKGGNPALKSIHKTLANAYFLPLFSLIKNNDNNTHSHLQDCFDYMMRQSIITFYKS